MWPAKAARSCGVHPKTFQKWMQRGRQGNSSKFVAFRSRIGQARAEAIRRLVGIVSTSATTNVESAKWLLARLAPRTYGMDRIASAEKRELEALRERVRQLSSGVDTRPTIQIIYDPLMRPTPEDEARGVRMPDGKLVIDTTFRPPPFRPPHEAEDEPKGTKSPNHEED